MSSINPFSTLSNTYNEIVDNIDENNALILYDKSNNNGYNYGWLNAPLYAFVAFSDVLNLYKSFKCPSEGIINEKQEIIYGEIYNLMVSSRNEDTTWDNDLYKSLHIKLCEISDCDNNFLPKVAYGNYSNNLPVMDIFKNVLVKNCQDNLSPLYVETYNPKVSDFANFKNELLKDKDGKKLIALVVDINPTQAIDQLAETNVINVGHFVAYVRNKNDDIRWKKYDSGKTEDRYNYELNTIFPSTTNKDKYWNFYAIYYKGDSVINTEEVSIDNERNIINKIDTKSLFQTKQKSNIQIENFVTIEKPLGKIVDFDIIVKDDETLKNTNKEYIYYTYDLEIDENIFYKIILKYPSSKYSVMFELFLNNIFSNFFSSRKYNDKFRDKEQFYPEMFTFLFGDYLKFIYDDLDLMKEINSVDIESNKKFIEYYSDKLNTYVDNYLNYGLRIDNSIEINRRKFLNNLMCSIIRPKENIKDNYNPTQKYIKDIPNRNYSVDYNLDRLYKNPQYNFLKINNEVFIIPEKRKSTYDMAKITQDFKNKKISDDEYEYLFNYDISEKINISNDFTYIINWIFKTVNKYFLNIVDVKNKKELEPTYYKLLNEYFEAQISIYSIKKDGKTEIVLDELNKFMTNNKNNPKNYRNIFYNKWKNLLNYFSNFNKYYYDDYYFNDLENKSQSLSQCLENFISSKLIPNDDNDDPSNFRYLFMYCLMSKQQEDEFKKLNINKDKKSENLDKQHIIKISKLKYNFFKYLKYIQNLNQFTPPKKCILDSNLNSKIINYSKYYFTKIIKFYEMDKLDFELEYEKETDIVIFKNYIINFIESDIVNHLYFQLKMDNIREKFYNGIKEFINIQYNKIYIEKSINLYKINYTASLKDLLSSILKQMIIDNADDFINKQIEKINSIIKELEKSEPKIKSSIKFTIDTELKCVGCPDFLFNKYDDNYYKQIINKGIEQIEQIEQIKNFEESELPPYGKVLMGDDKYEEQKENKLWVIDSEIHLQLEGSYNPKVIYCVESIIKKSRKYNFFDLLDIVDKEQKNEVIQIINRIMKRMTDYLQSEYDKNTVDFECTQDKMSSKFENKIFDVMDEQKINVQILDLFDGVDYNNVIELSYEYFIPRENTFGKYIYNLINANKYKNNEESFLEILKKNITSDENLIINDHNEFRLIFINFINDGLGELMKKYKYEKIEPKYEELIEDLSKQVIIKFKELTGIKIKGTNVIINIDSKNKLYSKIKLFLETCDQMEIISKYYEREQIEFGIKSFFNYYKDKEDKIPNQTANKDFCNEMFILFNTELKLVSKEEKVHNILINPEYYDLLINSYVSLGIVIANFIYKYKTKLGTEFGLDENTIQEYIKNALDYLYSIYLQEKEKLEENPDIYNYIFRDVDRYIYILKHINNLFNSIKFKDEVSPEYSPQNLEQIKNKMIDLIFRSNEKNLSFGNKILETDIFTDDISINLKLMKIFGYVKAINKIPKLSEQIETKTKLETKSKIKINIKPKTQIKPATTYVVAVEPSLEEKLKSTIEVNGTNIRIYIKPETKEPLYSIIKTYLETCDEISRLSIYYYPTQIESSVNLLINYYNDKLIKVDETTFCDDFTNNLICLMIITIIDTYNQTKLIAIHPDFFKIWVDKYINMGIIVINYILGSPLFKLEKYTQKALDYLSNFYLTKDFTGKITKDGFYNMLNDDINRYQYIVNCLNKFYDDERQFFIKNIKPKYTQKDMEMIEKYIIDLLMSNDTIDIPYYTKNIPDNIIIDMNDKLYNKTTKYYCISNNDFTKLINHFANELKINKKSEQIKLTQYTPTLTTSNPIPIPIPIPIPTLKIPVNPQQELISINQPMDEKILYNVVDNVFIIPDKYNYQIKSKNQGEPTNLKECLDKFLKYNYNLNMFRVYSKVELENIFNLMGKKLQNPSELPDKKDRNGKDIFREIKSKWCYNVGLKSLFTLARDELGISSR